MMKIIETLIKEKQNELNNVKNNKDKKFLTKKLNDDIKTLKNVDNSSKDAIKVRYDVFVYFVSKCKGNDTKVRNEIQKEANKVLSEYDKHFNIPEEDKQYFDIKEEVNYKANFDKVINNLKTINYDDECMNLFNRLCTINDGYYERKAKYRTDSDTFFVCIFGHFWINNNTTSPITKTSVQLGNFKQQEKYFNVSKRNGIEILGLVPKRTKDGKYSFQNFGIKELKQACKFNGIKGYSNLDKCQLVKLLMGV